MRHNFRAVLAIPAVDRDKKLVIERQRDIIFGVSSAEAERGPSEASFVWAGAALP